MCLPTRMSLLSCMSDLSDMSGLSLLKKPPKKSQQLGYTLHADAAEDTTQKPNTRRTKSTEAWPRNRSELIM